MTEPHRFSHEAMATTFEVFVADRPADYARQAAAAAFRELERLETELSRYVEGSDIARANRLAEGASLILGEDALRCLLDAMHVSARTGRAFDPAYASQRRPQDAPDVPVFALDPATHTLTSLAPRLHLDLGAVGKGYALDRMAGVLDEWDVTRACLQSGGSTVLARDPPAGAAGWPVGVADGIVPLARGAISGSGTAVQGAHVVDSRSNRPAGRTGRTWAFAATAAEADALSTAFFVMSDAEVAAYCRAHPECGAVLTGSDAATHWLGAAPRPSAPPE